MTGMKEFLEHVLGLKRNAEARGWKLDLMVLHREFYDTLMTAVGTFKPASDAFELRDGKEDGRKDIYLHGVKVMWSGNRLPSRQAWYRYSGKMVLT